MTPAVKQSFTVDLEGSRNIADIGITNLFGISSNLSYLNRNIWKNAIQSISNFRLGIELNVLNSNNQSDDLVQTFYTMRVKHLSFQELFSHLKTGRL